MKFSPQLKMNLGKVAVITICYILFNLFMAFFNTAMINSPFSLGPSGLFDFKTLLSLNMLVGLIAGIFGGAVLVMVNDQDSLMGVGFSINIRISPRDFHF